MNELGLQQPHHGTSTIIKTKTLEKEIQGLESTEELSASDLYTRLKELEKKI